MIDYTANPQAVHTRGGSRPSVHEYYLSLALLASTRSTCARNSVGCVLVNKFNRVIGMGHNGVASGLQHCIDSPCAGAKYPSGEGLAACEAIHAEASAIIELANPKDLHAMYVTHSPCIHCARMILNTSCKLVVFSEVYPHTEAIQLLGNNGVSCIHYSMPNGKAEQMCMFDL